MKLASHKLVAMHRSVFKCDTARASTRLSLKQTVALTETALHPFFKSYLDVSYNIIMKVLIICSWLVNRYYRAYSKLFCI